MTEQQKTAKKPKKQPKPKKGEKDIAAGLESDADKLPSTLKYDAKGRRVGKR